MGGNTPDLYAEMLININSLPDYSEIRPGGYAYIISLEGMADRDIKSLKTDVWDQIYL
jgi:hypothetical protein